MNTDSVLPVVFELFAKSAFIVLAAGLIVRAWRRATSAQRHLVWMAALVAIVLLPCARFAPPWWAIALQPARHISVTIPTATALPPVAVTDLPLLAHLPSTPGRLRPPIHWHYVVLALWLGGAALVLGYRLFGSWRVHRLYRRSVPVDDSRVRLLLARTGSELGLRRRVKVRLSEECCVPITWGTWRPVLLLPRQALTWSDTWLLAALRHEAAHIVRHDDLTRWVAWLACAVYWPNPFIWLAARSLRIAQEQSADDLVLRSGTPAEEYASQLVDTARLVAANGLFIRQAVAMACPSTLEDRIVAIVDGHRDRRPLSRLTVVLGLAATMLTLALSAVAQVQGAKEKDSAGAEPSERSGPEVTVTARFLEISPHAFDTPEAFPEPVSYQVYNDPELQLIIRALNRKKGVTLVASPSVTSYSGQETAVQIIREFRYATDWTKAGDVWEPKKFATKLLGPALNVTSTVLEGGNVELHVKCDSAELNGFVDLDAPDKPGDPSAKGKRLKPIFEEGLQETTVTIRSGQTLVLADIQPRINGKLVQTTGEYPKKRVAFITAKILDSAGKAKPAAAPVDVEAPSLQLDAAREAEDAAAKIIIPSLDLHDATVQEAVDLLRKKSHDLVKSGKEIEVVLSAPPEKKQKKVTIVLTNVPLGEAARYVAGLAELPMSFAPRAIFIGTPGETPAKPEGGNRSVKPEESPAGVKALGIIVPRVEVHEATVQETLDFLRVKAAEIDPQHVGVNILLKLPKLSAEPVEENSRGIDPANVRITLTLTNIPLYEALKYVADLAELQLVTLPNALLLRPAPKGAEKQLGAAAPPPLDPPPPAEPSRAKSPEIYVTVTKSGAILLDGKAVSEEVLKNRLQGVGPNDVVFLSDDADTPEKIVTQVFETLHRAGVAYVATSALSNEGLVTKVWKLPPDVVPLKPGGNAAERVYAKDWLIAKGVVFQGAASAVYTSANSQLVVRNTQAQLDLIDQILNKQMQQPPGSNR